MEAVIWLIVMLAIAIPLTWDWQAEPADWDGREGAAIEFDPGRVVAAAEAIVAQAASSKWRD